VLREITENDVSMFLKGQTALAVTSADPLAPARIIKGFPQLKVKGAFLEGKIYSQKEFSFLANLPPKEVLAAEVVTGIMIPVYNFVSLFDGLMASLIFSLESIRSMKEVP